MVLDNNDQNLIHNLTILRTKLRKSIWRSERKKTKVNEDRILRVMRVVTIEGKKLDLEIHALSSASADHES